MKLSFTDYLSNTPDSSHEFSVNQYFCVIEWCRDGPFTKLALRRHYEQEHYRCSLARTLAICTVKLQEGRVR